MSKLNNLLQDLCPNGVEYVKLKDIATDIFRGAGITREQVTTEGTPCVRYGEIYTTYGVFFDACVSHTNEEILQSRKYFEHGDILFAITGESVEEIAKSTAYVGYEKCLAGGDIVVMKHNQNPKYLGYVLSTTESQNQKSKGKVKSKVVHSSVPTIKEIIIPLPPLPVQEEIVRILDSYTKMTEELESKLKAELEARKKQYEFYRDSLLKFDTGGGSRGAKWEQLQNISDIGTGSHNTNEELEKGSYPFFVRSQDVRRLNSFDYDEEAIITSGDGVGVGKIYHYVHGKYALHQRAYRIHINTPNVLPKFFYYYMKTTFLPYIEKNAFNSSVTSIRRPMLNSYPVPIIPIKEQERIVKILDRFDKLCNDLTEGLPAEIESRRKQYEYYRDKLLTFTPAQ